MEATFKKTKVYKGVKFVIYELVDRMFDRFELDIQELKDKKICTKNY